MKCVSVILSIHSNRFSRSTLFRFKGKAAYPRWTTASFFHQSFITDVYQNHIGMIRDFSSKVPVAPETLIRSGKKSVTMETKDIDAVGLLQKTMSRVPQQVVVVTTAKFLPESQQWLKRGVTCSSFTSVSFHPPIVSFCLHKQSRMHDILQETDRFAVHVLAKNQISHSIHFSKSPQEDICQFQSVPHIQREEGLPIILGSLAALLCERHSVHSVGDHHIWHGNVTGASVSESLEDPLLYFVRSFRSVGDEIFLQAFEDATLPFENWTHEAHLRMAWNYIREYGRDGAVSHIKLGIQKFNEQNITKVKTGYHETITMFFIHLVADAINRCNLVSSFEEFLEANLHLTDAGLIYQYYNKETIIQEDARHKFILPDKKSLP